MKRRVSGTAHEKTLTPLCSTRRADAAGMEHGMGTDSSEGPAVPPCGYRNHGMATLRNGVHGDDVRQLQRHLDALGYPLAADGVFGPFTEQAVIAFQRHRGLSDNGVAGPEMVRTVMNAFLAQMPADT